MDPEARVLEMCSDINFSGGIRVFDFSSYSRKILEFRSSCPCDFYELSPCYNVFTLLRALAIIYKNDC